MLLEKYKTTNRYTYEELSVMLNVHAQTARDWCKSGATAVTKGHLIIAVFPCPKPLFETEEYRKLCEERGVKQ